MKLLSRISSVHTYNTHASTSEHFCTKESLLNVKRNAFSRVGVKIWNGIAEILKERPKKALKISLKATLFDILQTEDSYIDVDTITVKEKKVIVIFLNFVFISHSNIFVVYIKDNSTYLS